MLEKIGPVEETPVSKVVPGGVDTTPVVVDQPGRLVLPEIGAVSDVPDTGMLVEHKGPYVQAELELSGSPGVEVDSPGAVVERPSVELKPVSELEGPEAVDDSSEDQPVEEVGNKDVEGEGTPVRVHEGIEELLPPMGPALESPVRDDQGMDGVSEENVGNVSVITGGLVQTDVVDSEQSGATVTVDGVHVLAQNSPHTVTVMVVVWPYPG